MRKSKEQEDSQRKLIKGMSLIEILVTVGVFAIVGILITRATFLALKGSQKGGTTVKIRENLDYAMNIIERQLRNAGSITTCTSDKIMYEDSAGEPTFFECIGINKGDGYIASGSSRLTTPDAVISACSFSCTPGSSSTPPQVQIDISSEGFDLTTKIDLRTY